MNKHKCMVARDYTLHIGYNSQMHIVFIYDDFAYNDCDDKFNDVGCRLAIRDKCW